VFTVGFGLLYPLPRWCVAARCRRADEGRGHFDHFIFSYLIQQFISLIYSPQSCRDNLVSRGSGSASTAMNSGTGTGTGENVQILLDEILRRCDSILLKLSACTGSSISKTVGGGARCAINDPGSDGSTGVLGAVVGDVMVTSDGGTSDVGDDVLAKDGGGGDRLRCIDNSTTLLTAADDSSGEDAVQDLVAEVELEDDSDNSELCLNHDDNGRGARRAGNNIGLTVSSLSCDGGVDSGVFLFDPIEMETADKIGKAPIWRGDPAPHEGSDMYIGCQAGPTNMAPHYVTRVTTPTTGMDRDLTDGLDVGGASLSAHVPSGGGHMHPRWMTQMSRCPGRERPRRRRDRPRLKPWCARHVRRRSPWCTQSVRWWTTGCG
jgi:hypothetical protein